MIIIYMLEHELPGASFTCALCHEDVLFSQGLSVYAISDVKLERFGRLIYEKVVHNRKIKRLNICYAEPAEAICSLCALSSNSDNINRIRNRMKHLEIDIEYILDIISKRDSSASSRRNDEKKLNNLINEIVQLRKNIDVYFT